MSDCGHLVLIASGEVRGLCPLCQRAEIERLLALVEDCLQYMHNDFEPDNQSAVYYRIRRALEEEGK